MTATRERSLTMAFLTVALTLDFAPMSVVAQTVDDRMWLENLRPTLFGDAPVIESEDVIQLHIAPHAEDASVVPVAINARIPQTPERYVESVTLVIDNNPAPIAGRFTFTVETGRADLNFRVRINAATPVRAIAKLNDGSLYMSRRDTHAQGGCSTPVAADLEQALANLGKMKLRVGPSPWDDSPQTSSLRIRHPNITGMQTVGGKMTPAHFVEKVEVSYNGKAILSAETDISVSADPAFSYFFLPHNGGELVAKVTDSAGNVFEQQVKIKPRGSN